MSLLGCEWESIERYEKLCGVVSQCEKSKPHFLYSSVHDDNNDTNEGVWQNRLRWVLDIAVRPRYIFGHSLPKTMFKGVI